ncbi:hypothetical protein HG536_0A01610 [Torulaspora globosa]|uniref:Uncharacterized protein n=1 Tax=Torulaspora globosa TaxID=48254 RepID=A0A7G3ZA08_9SACH|nr:uncharacterized protein HG536_0A01610 [Torulaspora globosa]QLL30344.1 hypothetical protein HG536_0A01610 [Torulaspora globosa]
MKFVSCIAVSNVVDEEAPEDVVLCESDLGEQRLPESEQELSELMIEEIVISEGNEIHKRQKISREDLKIFPGTEREKSSLKGAIWHELVKLLTGHRVQLDSVKGSVQYTRWVCHAADGKTWYLAMEMEAGGIVRKLAQLDVPAVSEGEVDLFQMTNRLFASYCESSDAVKALLLRTAELESFLSERESLEKVRLERDDKTRSIMVNLLNEKKTRIAQLEQQLEEKCPVSGLGDIQDSEVINRNVREAVSELISPGKRRARAEQMKDDHKRKKVNRKLFPEPKIEPADDFDDDFQFFGITKVKEESPNSNSTPKKPAVKQESHEERLHETDSQNSHPIVDSRSTIGAESQSDTEADTEADTETEVPNAGEQSPASKSDPESSSQPDTDISSPG